MKTGREEEKSSSSSSPAVEVESEEDVRARKNVVYKSVGAIGCGALTGAVLSQTALLPLPLGAATMLFAADFGAVSVAYFSAEEILRRRFGRRGDGATGGESAANAGSAGPGPLVKPEVRGAAAGALVSPLSAIIFAKTWRPQPATILMHAAALAVGGAALGWAPPAIERWRRRTGARISAERERGDGENSGQTIPGGLRPQKVQLFGVQRRISLDGYGIEQDGGGGGGGGGGGEKGGAGGAAAEEEEERGMWDWLPVRKISDEEYKRRREAMESGTLPSMPSVPSVPSVGSAPGVAGGTVAERREGREDQGQER